MIVRGISINDMISQSMTVLTKPAVATFEEFERRGGQREALTYVGVAAAIGAAVALLFGLMSGIVVALVSGILSFLLPVVSFYITATIVHVVGTSQGGTGTKDEVFYTLSLFMAPILAINGAIGNIPFLACLASPLLLVLGLYQIYVGYLGIRSSMNLDKNKAIITMVVAWIVQFLIALAVGAVAGIIMATLGFAPASPSLPGITPP